MTQPLALLEAVRDLSEAAERNATELAALRQQQQDDRDTASADRKKSRRTRALAMVSLIGWVLDVALSIFAVAAIAVLLHFRDQQNDFNARQDCAASRTEAFLNAEHDKVSGQVAGWTVQDRAASVKLTGVHKIVAGRDKATVMQGLADFQRGIRMEQRGGQMIRQASGRYLDTIAKLSDKYHC